MMAGTLENNQLRREHFSGQLFNYIFLVTIFLSNIRRHCLGEKQWYLGDVTICFQAARCFAI